MVDHLRDLEERLLQPEVRQAAEEVAKLLAEEFVEFGSSGRIYRREDILEALGREVPLRRSLSQFKSQMLAPGVVLVTYRAWRQGEEAVPPESSWRSSVWKQIDGCWQMLFHQGTVAKEA